MNFKRFYYLISGVFLLHFTLVILYLFSDLLSWTNTYKYSSKYVTTFFDQHWSMFSQPGNSDIYIYFKYQIITDKKDTINTKWLDITTPTLKRGFLLLAADQRLSKYLDGCINSIFTANNEGIENYVKVKNQEQKYNLVMSYAKKSIGYRNLLEYSKLVLKGQNINQRVKKADLFIKIITVAFPDFEHKDQLNANQKKVTYVMSFTANNIK